MPLEPFHRFFPDVAQAEVRSVHVIDDPIIPPGDYAIIESYCTEPDCDCERVMLNVVEPERGIVASISFALNPAKIPGWFDEPNPFLDPLNPQSAYAFAVLDLVEELALDEEYLERLKRHNQMVRSVVKAGASHTSERSPWNVSGTVDPKERRANRARWMRKFKKAARRKPRRR